MAKARTKASVRDRAVAAFIKAKGLTVHSTDFLKVTKSRSKDIVTVRDMLDNSKLVWSYKGGNLRRLTASEAAGIKGLSACISGEYA